MLRKEEQIEVGGKPLTIKELTVGGLDTVLGALNGQRTPFWAEILFDSTIPVEVVTASAGLTKDDMKTMTPSELHAVWEAVARVNDFLFNGLNRLASLASSASRAVARENGSDVSSPE